MNDIKLAIINARSVLTDNKDGVKGIVISELLIAKELDFFVIIETWLSPIDWVICAQMGRNPKQIAKIINYMPNENS